MNEKLESLQVNRIIREYNLLKTDEELIKELISDNESEFLSLVNDNIANTDPNLLKPRDINIQKEPKKNEPKINIDGVDNNTKVKLKKIYREIVKLTHPDKCDDELMNDFYLKSKDAYESFDLFELYFIAKSLNINFKLTLTEKKVLNDLIEYKRDEIKKLESSFIWLWINASSEDEKKELVDRFLKTHYLK